MNFNPGRSAWPGEQPERAGEGTERRSAVGFDAETAGNWRQRHPHILQPRGRQWIGEDQHRPRGIPGDIRLDSERTVIRLTAAPGQHRAAARQIPPGQRQGQLAAAQAGPFEQQRAPCPKTEIAREIYAGAGKAGQRGVGNAHHPPGKLRVQCPRLSAGLEQDTSLRIGRAQIGQRQRTGGNRPGQRKTAARRIAAQREPGGKPGSGKCKVVRHQLRAGQFHGSADQQLD